ncbi:MAG: hypothetical protein HY796_06630 [Elusimicrobia bacterium]|nr:hypothetical protein [Elusimicrobiota bacterium]
MKIIKEIILGLGKIVLCGGIILAVLISVENYMRTHKKYDLHYHSDSCGWLRLKIGQAKWIAGYNYTERFIYGKTPVSWFVVDTQNCKTLEFRGEKNFQDYLRSNGVKLKKLIEVPIFKIPTIPYGYKMTEGRSIRSEKTVLVLFRGETKNTGFKTIPLIAKVGLMDDYVIGENDKGWFYVHMPTGKTLLTKNLDELAVVLRVTKNELSQKIIAVPDYKKYKLPFEKCAIDDAITWTGWTYQLIGDYPDDQKWLVRVIEYHRKKKGYIYGKSTADFFIFNIKSADCAYFGQKKEDWLKELDRLKLPHDKFTMLPAQKVHDMEYEPWLIDLRYKEYFD